MSNLQPLILSLLLVLLVGLELSAQIKFEKEERIKEDQVPVAALQFMSDSGIDSKIKWYRETSQEGIHIEGKTIHRGIKHSIEFDTLGRILDIEREFKLPELGKSQAENITSALDGKFERYRIKKIQSQWTGRREVLIDLMLGNEATEAYKLRFEIVVSGRHQGQAGFFEVLLEPDGQLVELLTIVPRASDNLDF